MALRKCRGCNSWVLPDARKCPTCGLVSPSPISITPNRSTADWAPATGTLVLAFAGLAAGYFFGASRAAGDVVALSGWALTGLVSGWLAGDLLFGLFARATTTVGTPAASEESSEPSVSVALPLKTEVAPEPAAPAPVVEQSTPLPATRTPQRAEDIAAPVRIVEELEPLHAFDSDISEPLESADEVVAELHPAEPLAAACEDAEPEPRPAVTVQRRRRRLV